VTRVHMSPDSGKAYLLTIDADGRATDCSCMDRKVRTWKPACKHMIRFNEALAKAEAFMALKARYDYRNHPFSYLGEDGNRHTARRIDWNKIFDQDETRARIEAAKPARYTEAEIRAAQRLNQSREFSLMR